MIPCVMNAKQRGSQPWRVSNNSASCGHQCVLLVVKHRLWTPIQPKLPLLPSLREMGSHLLMSSPPIVKRHPHHVTRPHIVKRYPLNLLIYTASNIVVMVDREMEIWLDAVCASAGTMNSVYLMAQSDRTRHGGCAHHAVPCRTQSEWWVTWYSHFSKVWTRCWPLITNWLILSRI